MGWLARISIFVFLILFVPKSEARRFPILEALYSCEQGVTQAMAERFSIDMITEGRTLDNEVEPGSGLRNLAIKEEFKIETLEDIQISPTYSTEFSVLGSSYEGRPGLMIYTGVDNAFAELPPPTEEPTEQMKVCLSPQSLSISGMIMRGMFSCGEMEEILTATSGIVPRYMIVDIPGVGQRAFRVTTTMMAMGQTPTGIVSIPVEQAEREASILGLDISRDIRSSLLTDDRLNVISDAIQSKIGAIHGLRTRFNYRTQTSGWDQKVNAELRRCQQSLSSLDHPSARSLLKEVEAQLRLLETFDARPITAPVPTIQEI